MKFIQEDGESFEIDEKALPECLKKYNWQKLYAISKSVKVEKIWVAFVYKKDFGARGYECIAEERYDHAPSEDEILKILHKYEAFACGYVTIDEGYRGYAYDWSRPRL